MSFIRKFIMFLPPNVVQRGSALHYNGMVHIISGDADRVVAWVRGGSRYDVRTPAARLMDALAISIWVRDKLGNGSWGKLKESPVPMTAIPGLQNPVDREILLTLAGSSAWAHGGETNVPSTVSLYQAHAEM